MEAVPVGGLTIVVVTYNSAAHLDACLQAALRWTPQVIVVDNASADSSLAAAARWPVRCLANPTNLGFGAAANQGFELAATEYVLLLNPDVVLGEGMQKLMAAAQPASCGLLVGADGRVQTGFSVRRLPRPADLAFEVLGLNRMWPNNPWNRRWRCLDLDLTRPQVVEQPAGALLMLRREVWASAGGFDERFWPVWFEDVDFCHTLRDLGHRISLVPEATAAHAGGHSVLAMAWEDRERFWYRNLWRYSVRRFGPSGQMLVAAALTVGLAMRAIRAVVARRSMSAVGMYATVLASAFRGTGSAGRRAE
jgi:GT2 family glycosyltransferase